MNLLVKRPSTRRMNRNPPCEVNFISGTACLGAYHQCKCHECACFWVTKWWYLTNLLYQSIETYPLVIKHGNGKFHHLELRFLLKPQVWFGLFQPRRWFPVSVHQKIPWIAPYPMNIPWISHVFFAKKNHHHAATWSISASLSFFFTSIVQCWDMILSRQNSNNWIVYNGKSY